MWRSDTTFFLDPHLLQNSLFVILGTACQVSTKFGKSILGWRGIQSNTSKEPCPFTREDDSESTLTTYKIIFFYIDIGPILRNLVINRDSKFFLSEGQRDNYFIQTCLNKCRLLFCGNVSQIGIATMKIKLILRMYGAPDSNR